MKPSVLSLTVLLLAVSLVLFLLCLPRPAPVAVTVWDPCAFERTPYIRGLADPNALTDEQIRGLCRRICAVMGHQWGWPEGTWDELQTRCEMCGVKTDVEIAAVEEEALMDLMIEKKETDR